MSKKRYSRVSTRVNKYSLGTLVGTPLHCACVAMLQPLSHSLLLNPCKTEVLPVLPSMAPLGTTANQEYLVTVEKALSLILLLVCNITTYHYKCELLVPIYFSPFFCTFATKLGLTFYDELVLG